jgi:hypothetical protein
VKKMLRWITIGKITLLPFFFTKLCLPSFPVCE